MKCAYEKGIYIREREKEYGGQWGLIMEASNKLKEGDIELRNK